MVQCTQWYSAKDNNGNAMPGTVYADLQSWNGSFWESIGNLEIPNILPPESTSLQAGDRFRVAPMPVSGYITPSEIEFTACGKDIVLVYTKKEAVWEIVSTTSPPTSKSGDNVTINVQSWNKGDVAGIFQVKLYDSDTGGLVHTFTQRTLNSGASINELAFPYPVMPSKDWNLIAKLYADGKTVPDDTKSFTIGLETVIGNGFTIRVSNALVDETIIIGHVVKIVGTDLWYWPQNFGYVGGQWYFAKPATIYRIEVGSILETIPPFNKTYGTGSFADGIHCVVLAEGASGVNTLVFKDEDVFQLFADSPTEINLSSVSNDVISEALMGPVCDFFGISRGSECNSFWAEFYDPVYVANYVSIMRTGKDTLGNDRELSGFDHIALPFAILGSLPGLSLLPFGALVTRGLKTVSKAGTQFSEGAIQFMLQFSMDATNKVSSKDTWYFLDAIGQVTEDRATEIVNALTAGDTMLADTLLRQYAGESKGWWDYHKLNDMLRDALPTDAYNWLRKQIGLDEIGAGIVTNTAKQATLSPDCVLKLADAVEDTGVMDSATLAVYRSLRNLDFASATKIDELRNILKNSPEISAKLIANHKSVLDKVASGQRVITREEIKTILHHADIAPDDIVELVKSSDNLALIVNALKKGQYEQSLGNFLDSTKKYWDFVNTQVGKSEADTWVRNNAKISRKALDTNDPAKMADIPHAGQEIAAKQNEIINEAVAAIPEVTKIDAEDFIFDIGRSSADEIADVTQVFVDEVPTNWYTKARQTASVIPKRLVKKWTTLKRYEKVLVIWFMVDNVAFIIYMIAKFLGLGPGDRGFDAWNLAKSVTDASWLCKASCEDKRYSDLEGDIVILEGAITNLEEYLDKYEFSLKLENNYEAPHSVLEIGKSSLKLMQECLVNRGIEIAPSTGKIVFFAKDTNGQPVTSGAYVDNHRVGTIWGSGLEISEVDPGSYDLEVKATGYVGCTKTVNVEALKTETFECVLEQIGACSPVTDVKIYIDPLSPVEGQKISFNGSAKSNDPIRSVGWQWKFGDGGIEAGQAVEHTYRRDGIYKAELIVTNECGESAFTERNVTVSEEEPPVESTTLTIERMIGTDGNDIPRYWEVEIWVDGKYTKCQGPQTLTFGTGEFCDCESPWNLVRCDLGRHTITLKKYGYDDLKRMVSLIKDIPETWGNPVMVKSVAPPPEHTVSVDVPKGAMLWVDGKLIETTTVGRLTTILNELRK